jgi:tetratricopeptide (TPR) repeat protein
MRSGKLHEALQEAEGMAAAVKDSDPLAKDVYLLIGWAREQGSRGKDPEAEKAFRKVLELDPNSPKGRLGLAIHLFREGGMRASESDFRLFLESLPELDPPSRVLNFRKMSDFDFYNFSRSELRELNAPMGAAGTKPSPLVMAVDAMLSCLQSRTGEAGKILEDALSISPGDHYLLKAVGYHRWKEGRYSEILDLLKDLPDERDSFALNLLVGKAYLKTGNLDQAEPYVRQLIALSPERAIGWSLLGEIQFRKDQIPEAKKDFENALRHDPLDLAALKGINRLGLFTKISPQVGRNLPF